MNQKVIIWGAGGHAVVVADIMRSEGRYEIAGFLDDLHPGRHDKPFCGSIILGGSEQLEGLAKAGITRIIIGFGDNNARLKAHALARKAGLEVVTAIHPFAVVAKDVTIGKGSVVCAGAVINPAARIGESAIVNTRAVVDHECILEDGSHLGPGALLGGKVKVGVAAWVGIGAVISDHVNIGDGAIIGAGAMVLKDVPGGVVAYGSPAKVIKGVE